ncbi:MAG: aminopeptidase, partial [Clostridiales bacterium]|nr:aminopeptidase [Clostridiales bacterium]
MDKNKSEAKKLKEKLLINYKNSGLTLSDEFMEETDAFCEKYKDFLDKSKTERQAVITSIAMAKERGFTEYEKGKKYAPGDKIYYNNRGKALILA